MSFSWRPDTVHWWQDTNPYPPLQSWVFLPQYLLLEDSIRTQFSTTIAYAILFIRPRASPFYVFNIGDSDFVLSLTYVVISRVKWLTIVQDCSRRVGYCESYLGEGRAEQHISDKYSPHGRLTHSNCFLGSSICMATFSPRSLAVTCHTAPHDSACIERKTGRQGKRFARPLRQGSRGAIILVVIAGVYISIS